MGARERSDSLNPEILARAVRILCLAIVVVGTLDWLGWAAGIDILTRGVPGWIPMRPWTALWLAALALAISLQTDEGASERAYRVARALGLATGIVALVVLVEYRRGAVLDIDLWWFGHAVQRSPLPLPGRPSQQTALPTLLLAIAVAMMRVEWRWVHPLRLILVSFGAFIPLVALISELFAATGAIRFSASVQTAPTTALALILLSSAIVMARPDRPPMQWFMTRPDNASVLRLLIVLLGFPLALWTTRTLLVLLGANAQTGQGFSIAFSTVVVCVGVFVVSRRQLELVGERGAMVEHLRESEARYRLLAENASDLVFSVAVDRTLTWASPSALTVLGYAPHELLGQPASLIVHPDDQDIVERYRTVMVNGRPSTARVRLVTKRGDSVWCEASARRIIAEDGSSSGVVAAVRNISAEVAAEAALEHEVAFDGLTGLLRKEPALQRIREMLAEHAEDGWWLLCVGVNGMTQINQAYTYTAGDEVLKAVARRLVDAVGAHDRVARIAGDEFVVLKPDIVSASIAATAAERILATVRGGVVVGDTELHVTACIGIATGQSEDAEELLRDATAAMRQAAQKGPDRWEFLDGNVAAQTREALHIQNELRVALVEGRIEAWFMPIVALPGREVVGFEALARWRREDGAVWGPDLFLDIAERSSLIGMLDHVIFQQTLEAARRAPAEITFSYNVSASSLASEAFPAWIAEELIASGVDPRRLKFEITETSIFHVTGGIKETMHALADLGIDWWVDDFGTGFSSISHLRDLPIAGLKLDKSFTTEIAAEDGHSERLAGGLLGLASGLELTAVAEGVENEEQEAQLTNQGWTFAQGWLYGKPAPSAW